MKPQHPLTGLEIAIIGMDARFPGAQNIDEFWDNLAKGIESITFYNQDQLAKLGVNPEMINHPAFVPAVSIIKDKAYFDAAFFGYTPIEAEVMDPQLRLFHEIAWGALENAGYVPGQYPGLIGLYAGAGMNFYWEAHTVLSGKTLELGPFESAMLNNKDFTTSRLSYKLNLHGPSVCIHTACSTSLVAVHLAARAVLTGECSMALAGAIALAFPRNNGYMYQEGMINSPDGHCRSFDEKSRGTIFGEGGGIVVLKRLNDAIKDRDTVYAVIKGSAINNDGLRKVGYTAPSTSGEAEVIRRALKVAKVEPESITYIEAHGTGTPLGDTIETEALKEAFAIEKKNSCAVGSVKTNIGHLDVAAGIASLIKTVCALYHQQLPPSLHFEKPNPHINFNDSPFFINTTLRQWKNDRFPLRAGVNGFGIGGTNAHIVLEEAPPNSKPDPRTPSPQTQHLLLLSAQTPTALERQTINLTRFLELNPHTPIAHVAYTLQVGRKAFKYRRILLCQDGADAIAKLHAPNDAGVIHSAITDNNQHPLIFLFSGLGSQHLHMARHIYEQQPFFKKIMDQCFDLLTPLGYPLKELLYPKNPTTPLLINQVDIAQLALFSIQYALASLLNHWGFIPSLIMGYSFGEYAAAASAGVFSLNDGLKLIAQRCQLMASLPNGAMTSIPLPLAQVQELINNQPHPLSLCIDNGPSCIVGGQINHIEQLEKKLKTLRIIPFRLPSSHAVHSSMMDPILAQLQQAAASIQLLPPSIPYISNVTGQLTTQQEATSPLFWARHLRETVRFNQGLQLACQQKTGIFIEIGPGRDLTTLISRSFNPDSQQKSLNLLPPPNDPLDSYAYFLNKIGYLWLSGKNPDWTSFHNQNQYFRIPLPTYPFEKIDFSEENTPFTPLNPLPPTNDKILKNNNIADWFYLPLWKPSVLPLPPLEPNPKTINRLIFARKDELVSLITMLKNVTGQTTLVYITNQDQPQTIDPATWEINPALPGHYRELFKNCSESGSFPDQIIHLWNAHTPLPRPDHPEPEPLQPEMFHGFYSLLFLVQACHHHGKGKPLYIDLVTRHLQQIGSEPVLNPVQGMVQGILKVIPQEHPHIRCRSIDISDPIDENQLFDELTGEPHRHVSQPDIAYRSNQRWVRAYEPVPLATLTSPQKQCKTLKPGGVYLLTGGTGGMGLTLAQYLAKNYQARLVLVSRSPLPPRQQWENLATQPNPLAPKLKILLDLEKNQAQLLTLSADVANLQDMENVFQQSQQHFGEINGIFHLAGLLHGPSFQGLTSLSVKNCELQFQSKVYALLVLEELQKKCSLDFCVIASSIASVLGGVAFAAYASANAFIDAYVAARNHGASTPWTTINWDSWAFDQGETTQPLAPSTALVMTPAEGVECYMRILAHHHLHHVIHSLGNLPARIERWVKLGPIQADNEAEENQEKKTPRLWRPRPDMMTAYIAPDTPIEKTITETWQGMLGYEKIGVNDSFFELGGDSLKVLTMTAKIHKKLEKEIPVPDFFKNPTIRGICELIKEVETTIYQRVTPSEEKEYYPLSHAQKRLLIIQQMEKQSTGYNEYMIFILAGQLDPERLRQTFIQLMTRHESLRTSFHVLEDQMVQRIHPIDDVELEFEELQIDTSLLAEEEVLKKFPRAFNPAIPPMFRVRLIDTGYQRYVLAIEMHHIISDGLSYQIFVQELTTLYQEKTALSPLLLQYKDFAQWQNSGLQQERYKKQESYWLNRFAGPVPLLKLPYDFPRPPDVGFEGGTQHDYFDLQTSLQLKQFVKEQEVTLFMLLLTLFNTWMYRLSAQEDIVVGTPIIGRNQEELQSIIGMFVNTLALRSFPGGRKPFLSFLREVKEIILEAFAHQDYPFEELTDKSGGERLAGRNPLFDVLFTWQNVEQAPLDVPQIQSQDLVFQTYPSDQLQHAQFDLLMFAHEAGDVIGFKLVYRTQLFKAETITRFIQYFKEITMAVLKNPDIQLKDIEISHQLGSAQLEIPDTDFDF